MNTYYVYMLTNKGNNVLYIGVTNNLERRIYEHKNKLIEGFTKKYNCNKLIWFKDSNDIESVIVKEKQMKTWKRQYKLNVIDRMNPDWKDLSNDF